MYPPDDCFERLNARRDRLDLLARRDRLERRDWEDFLDARSDDATSFFNWLDTDGERRLDLRLRDWRDPTLDGMVACCGGLSQLAHFFVLGRMTSARAHKEMYKIRHCDQI